MRFLCLHGRGGNKTVFESQTARIRDALGSGHQYVFINGNVATDPMPGIGDFASAGKKFYGYSNDGMTEVPALFEGLIQFVKSNGPFEGIMAFSEGAAVAAMLIIAGNKSPYCLGIKCGIFFCGLTPIDLAMAQTGQQRFLKREVDGVMVDIPTAHIWSDHGDAMGSGLVCLCEQGLREEQVHSLGHDVPGSRSDEGLSEAVRAIERTIARAH